MGITGSRDACSRARFMIAEVLDRVDGKGGDRYDRDDFWGPGAFPTPPPPPPGFIGGLPPAGDGNGMSWPPPWGMPMPGMPMPGMPGFPFGGKGGFRSDSRDRSESRSRSRHRSRRKERRPREGKRKRRAPDIDDVDDIDDVSQVKESKPRAAKRKAPEIDIDEL